ncbi:MAG: dihydroorotase [Candidatus Saccharimonadales bacterium]
MSKTIILPGLVDMHVHLRDPGYTEAEDFDSGTAAALAGGVVAVFDMPNNKNETKNTIEILDLKIKTAANKARINVGFYFGAVADDKLIAGSQEYNELVDTFKSAGAKTFGLKLYCDITTGNQHQHGADSYRSVVKAWLQASPNKLIIVHTEGSAATTEMIRLVAGEMKSPIHIAHISKQTELEAVIAAKKDRSIAGHVTTGVCPHHLFLTSQDIARLGWYGRMKPSLGTTADQDFLRANIASIDVIETDHAPHTIIDKENAQVKNPDGQVAANKPTCYGVPGLEAMLPLLLQAEHDGWITRDQIIEKTSTKPCQILGVKNIESEVHVKLDPFIFSQKNVRSKCGWSPYVGMKVIGNIEKVTVGDQLKYNGQEILAKPGDGRVLTPS